LVELESMATTSGWTACSGESDRSRWHPQVSGFFDYWLSIAPPGRLPGRQHFDPLHIPKLMPSVWILDVVREGEGVRFRYRLAGTREVGTLEREVTGSWLDEAHPHLRGKSATLDRCIWMAAQGKPTYRKGPVTLSHHKDHRLVENCFVPLARDGALVDMIAACSVLYRLDGSEA
jgi:hypothetical protein